MHTPLSKTRQQSLALYVKLMRATNRVTGDIHRHLVPENLTHSQFAVLEALYNLGPLSLGELGRKILKSNANLTTVVDSLEKKNLVLRQQCIEDRRRFTVSLTGAGEELIARVFLRHAEIVERELGVLSPLEQQQLAELLKKLGLGG